MRLNSDFISYNVDGENILVCLDSKKFAGVIKLNKTAAFIVEQLKEETERETVLSAMKSRFAGASEEEMKEDLETVIMQLSSAGAVDL